MNAILVPPVGLIGRFLLREPLNTVLSANILYTVTAVESLSKLLADNIDVKTIMYLSQGLTADQYLSDLKNNIPMVTLKTEADELFYIPANLIENMPEATGIVYKQRAIVINLGYVNDTIDIESVGIEVCDLVKGYTGLDVSAEDVDLSGSYILSYEEDDAREAKRMSNITNVVTCKARLLKCEEILASYKVKLHALAEKLKIV